MEKQAPCALQNSFIPWIFCLELNVRLSLLLITVKWPISWVANDQHYLLIPILTQNDMCGKHVWLDNWNSEEKKTFNNNNCKCQQGLIPDQSIITHRLYGGPAYTWIFREIKIKKIFYLNMLLSTYTQCSVCACYRVAYYITNLITIPKALVSPVDTWQHTGIAFVAQY